MIVGEVVACGRGNGVLCVSGCLRVMRVSKLLGHGSSWFVTEACPVLFVAGLLRERGAVGASPSPSPSLCRVAGGLELVRAVGLRRMVPLGDAGAQSCRGWGCWACLPVVDHRPRRVHFRAA